MTVNKCVHISRCDNFMLLLPAEKAKSVNVSRGMRQAAPEQRLWYLYFMVYLLSLRVPTPPSESRRVEWKIQTNFLPRSAPTHTRTNTMFIRSSFAPRRRKICFWLDALNGPELLGRLHSTAWPRWISKGDESGQVFATWHGKWGSQRAVRNCRRKSRYMKKKAWKHRNDLCKKKFLKTRVKST